MTYWFDPMVGGAGGILGGGAATGQPAMSTAQINASMGWNPAAQAQTTNLYGPMGFGGQTAMYAGIGAGYGRQVAPSSPAAVAAAGGQADRLRALYPQAFSGGGIGSDAARAPSQPAIQPTYRAPMSYGWGHNEGAPAPAAPQVYNRGQFNPQTYGWDHNEGAPFGMGLPNQPQQSFQDLWNSRGRVYQPPVVPSPYGPGGYPPMAPRGGEGQSNLNWYGMPTASS